MTMCVRLDSHIRMIVLSSQGRKLMRLKLRTAIERQPVLKVKDNVYDDDAVVLCDTDVAS